MDYEQLSRMVAMGIAASVGDLKSALGDRALGGYALCVDDSLRTVFPVAASAAFLAEQDAEVRFVAVDWDIEEGADDRFDHANAALGELADHARDYAVHIRLAFAALVDALHRVRKSGVFAPGVTLLVTSTDPGELTLRLADDAVLKLNDAETQRAFREIMR